MGAETLLKEVEEKRKTALKQLEDEYAAKMAEVQKRTQDERTHILEAASTEAAALSQREQTRVAGAAKLQAKKMVFDATERMLEANISALRQVLARVCRFRRVLPSPPAGWSGTPPRGSAGSIGVRCRAADVQAIKKAGAVVLSADLPTIGGFKAESEDGDFELDLTFEEMLRTHEDQVRASILGKE